MMGQFSFEQKIEIASKMALDYCEENGLKFRQYNQKFAELIIRECAGVVEDAVLHREPASTYVGKIRQHFGVEE